MSSRQQITVNEARSKATVILREAGIDSAALDARVLLAHVLGVSQTALLMRDPELLPISDLTDYRNLVHRRATGVPVAYLVGHREFMGLNFFTAPGVLVPRPDTEPLVEWGLDWIRTRPHTRIADIGTGSGAIAVSMVFHADDSWQGTLVATDISDEALAIASSNADALLPPDLRQRITFEAGDLTSPLADAVDLLLTNLPYLTPVQIAGNANLRHEPALALDGGVDGLDLVRRAIDDLPRILAPGGAVGFEIDPSQSVEVQQLLSHALPDHRIEVVQDLAGDARHIVAF